MAVIALAHPQKPCGEHQGFARISSDHFEGPALLLTRPAGRANLVLVAKTRLEFVLLDHLSEVGQDLLSRGDGGAGPGFETVSEGKEVAIGAGARVAMGLPGSPEVVHRLQDQKLRIRTLLDEMATGTDPGDSGADHQHIHVLDTHFAVL